MCIIPTSCGVSFRVRLFLGRRCDNDDNRPMFSRFSQLRTPSKEVAKTESNKCSKSRGEVIVSNEEISRNFHFDSRRYFFWIIEIGMIVKNRVIVCNEKAFDEDQRDLNILYTDVEVCFTWILNNSACNNYFWIDVTNFTTKFANSIGESTFVFCETRIL